MLSCCAASLWDTSRPDDVSSVSRRGCEPTTGERGGTLEQPTAEEALRRLEPLVGEWTVEAKWPNGEPWPGGGKIIFEWHDSGAHLVERGSVELPEAPDNVSIIGCDAANGTYVQLYSDERG